MMYILFCVFWITHVSVCPIIIILTWYILFFLFIQQRKYICLKILPGVVYLSCVAAFFFFFLLIYPSDSAVKNPPAMQKLQELWVQSLGWEDSLDKGIATHSSILAWRIPWTEEPGGLWSIGLQSQTQLKRLSTSYT